MTSLYKKFCVFQYNHYRSYKDAILNNLYVALGRVGLWKDIFTVSMNDKFDAVYRQKMGKSDLTFDFGLWTKHMA